MDYRPDPSDNLLDIDILREREKELNCLYMVDEILTNPQLSVSEIFSGIVNVLPLGWRFPDLCRAKIVYKGSNYQSPGYVASPVSDSCIIKEENKNVGIVEVTYIRDVPETPEGYFLERERRLIRSVAERIGQTMEYRQMKTVFNEWEVSRSQTDEKNGKNTELMVMLDFFRHSDRSLLLHICRKLVNYMLISGVKEASQVFSNSRPENFDSLYTNYPTPAGPLDNITDIFEKAFRLAAKYFGKDEITARIIKWIQEENAHSLIKALSSINPSLRNIIDELERFSESSNDDKLLFSPKGRWITVKLIKNILSDKPDFINIAKQFLNYRDFFDISSRIIHPLNSQGKLGGKSTGLFLARKILLKESEKFPLLESIKYPKTWYITTDTITEFLHYNNLEELNEQKYKELHEIRLEYPNIIHLLKNSKLPLEIMRSLSAALDDFGDSPIIVRSSSILEDQVGAAFSGKYKSLFLANQGSKSQRLEALKDAVIEVYASMFSPDAILYRAEKGLLDIHEEMGIMIQEVVGRKVGKYFFPLFAGVAFSNNEYRWSPRIKHDDGLIRMVPGLGTRAVDRLTDDFPMLVSPGQPGIRVNIIPDEIKRYSPRKIDVINLSENRFETVDISALLRETGENIPGIEKLVSIMEYKHIRSAGIYEIDFKKDDLVVTFDGIISDSTFIRQIHLILKTLKDRLGYPADIEFACDGNNLYLLQCRPQCFGEDTAPAPVPKDLPQNNIIFSANRYISNGLIQNISHIVYVDPDGYSSLNSLDDLKTVGKIVGLLNTILPKRQFILIGPGRWGSRGDIKLGVSVSYADICNTAALIEVARKKSDYMPELSFGTHFFQDLVEAKIRFLPVYPDDENVIFNERYLTRSKNLLGSLFPDYSNYEDVVKVIDVPDSSGGYTLSIAMNAMLGEALAFLTPHPVKIKQDEKSGYHDAGVGETAWRWRHHMAERLASHIDSTRFGVKAVYLFGSTATGTAGHGSDIDLLIHFTGTEEQKADLLNWLDGWSLSLAEINYMKTGYNMKKLLDVHIITNEDIKNKSSFAIRINHAVDPAQPLKIKSDSEN